MINKNLQYLRHLKGFTLVETSAYLNNILEVEIKSRFYQTKDKVFTYERNSKPVLPKPEVFAALCKLYHVTEDELMKHDMKKMDIKKRWDHSKNMMEEGQAEYGNKSEDVYIEKQLEKINGKLDLLIKLAKIKP